MFYIIPIIISIILITFVLFILNWLNKLEKNKCLCAINNKRFEQIKYYWYFILIMYIISFLMNVFIYSSYITEIIINNDLLGIFIIFNIFISLWHIYNSYNTYLYMKEIDNSKCSCGSVNNQRRFVFDYSIILGILGLILFIFLLPFLVIYIKSCGFFNNHTEKCINFINKIRNKK